MTRRGNMAEVAARAGPLQGRDIAALVLLAKNELYPAPFICLHASTVWNILIWNRDKWSGYIRRLDMAVPDSESLLLPILKIASDGKEHSNFEVYEILTQQFGLNESDRKDLISIKRSEI